MNFYVTFFETFCKSSRKKSEMVADNISQKFSASPALPQTQVNANKQNSFHIFDWEEVWNMQIHMFSDRLRIFLANKSFLWENMWKHVNSCKNMEILLKFWTGFGQNSAMQGPSNKITSKKNKVWKLQKAPNQSVWYKLTLPKTCFLQPR